MIPAWAAAYVGIPYVDKGRTHAGADCYGLVRLVLAEVFHVNLPDYGEGYRDGEDWAAIGSTIREALLCGWQRSEQPRAGDLLVVSIATRPWHCAVMLNSTQFLHAPPGATSVIERLDNPRWARRIEGIYRHD